MPVIPVPTRLTALLRQLYYMVEERGEDALAKEIKYAVRHLVVQENGKAAEVLYEALAERCLYIAVSGGHVHSGMRTHIAE
jgi:hypothetical protein